MQIRACFFILCFIVLKATAQQLPLETYTPANGLVDARITKMYQDSKGRLYFLTREGFSIYDGQRFDNYANTSQGRTDIISDITEYKDGTVKLFTFDGNVYVVGNNNDVILDTGNADVLTEINQVLSGENDDKLFLTNYNFILERNGKLTKLNLIKLLGYGTIRGMISRGNKLIVSAEKYAATHIYLYDYNKQIIEDSIVGKTRILSSFGENAIYVYTNKWGQISTDMLRQNKLWIEPVNNLKNLPLLNKNIELQIDSKGNFWLYNKEKGMYKIEGNNATISYFKNTGVFQNCKSIFEDKESNIWFISYGIGVQKLQQTALLPVNELANTKINAAKYISKTNDGSVFFNTSEGIIKDNKKISPVSDEYFFYWQNQYWKIKNQKFLQSNTGTSFDLKNFYPGYNETDFRFIPKTTIDNNDNILLSGSVLLLLTNKLKLYAYKLPYYADNIVVDKDNNYWCFMRSSQVLCLQFKDGIFSIKFNKHLPELSPRYALLWDEHTFFIGTRSNGIEIFKQEKNDLIYAGAINKIKGLSNNFIYTLLKQNSTVLLAGSATGLDKIKISIDDTAIENLTASSNVFKEFYDLQQDKDSTVYCHATGGVLYKLAFNEISNTTFKPRLFLNNIFVNDKKINRDSINHFAHNSNNLRFEVSSPSFVNNKSIVFDFLLESENNSWQQRGNEAIFKINNLLPGSYKLTVNAVYAGNFYPGNTIAYNFIIKKPFWKTIGFIAALIVLISLLLYAYFKNILSRRLQRQKIELEKQQAIAHERSRIATDMHDDLGAGISTIKFLSQTAPYIPAEQQQQNNLKISAQADELVDKMNDIIWAMNEKNDTLDNLIYYTKAWTAIFAEQHQIQPHISIPPSIEPLIIRGEKRQHIFMCIKESVHNIIKHAEAKNMWLDIEINKSKLHITIRDDGKGFDPMKNFSGNGLSNIQKRIKAMNGEMKTKINNGTCQQFIIPL